MSASSDYPSTTGPFMDAMGPVLPGLANVFATGSLFPMPDKPPVGSAGAASTTGGTAGNTIDRAQSEPKQGQPNQGTQNQGTQNQGPSNPNSNPAPPPLDPRIQAINDARDKYQQAINNAMNSDETTRVRSLQQQLANSPTPQMAQFHPSLLQGLGVLLGSSLFNNRFNNAGNQFGLSAMGEMQNRNQIDYQNQLAKRQGLAEQLSQATQAQNDQFQAALARAQGIEHFSNATQDAIQQAVPKVAPDQVDRVNGLAGQLLKQTSKEETDNLAVMATPGAGDAARQIAFANLQKLNSARYQGMDPNALSAAIQFPDFGKVFQRAANGIYDQNSSDSWDARQSRSNELQGTYHLSPQRAAGLAQQEQGSNTTVSPQVAQAWSVLDGINQRLNAYQDPHDDGSATRKVVSDALGSIHQQADAIRTQKLEWNQSPPNPNDNEAMAARSKQFADADQRIAALQQQAGQLRSEGQSSFQRIQQQSGRLYDPTGKDQNQKYKLPNGAFTRQDLIKEANDWIAAGFETRQSAAAKLAKLGIPVR